MINKGKLLGCIHRLLLPLVNEGDERNTKFIEINLNDLKEKRQ